MNSGRTVFAQLIEHLPHKEFQKCVARYRGEHYDIETCLGAVCGKLYHMGFRSSYTECVASRINKRCQQCLHRTP